MDKKFSIVLPAYLEEENLRLLLPRIVSECQKLSAPFEVLVVDTKEPLDSTEAVCAALGARYVRRQPGNSFGDAVRTGIKEARGAWILFMDADGSHGPDFIPKLAAQIPENDIVVASRYVAGGFTENSRTLVFMSRVLNFSYSLILGIRCKDVSNSFKIYRADLLKDLSLKSENFDIIEEILFKITRKHRNVKICELPFSFKKRMFGESKRNLVLFMMTYLWTMVRLRLSIVGEQRA
jgi:dolichol-phosphate mannosyltransferase